MNRAEKNPDSRSRPAFRVRERREPFVSALHRRPDRRLFGLRFDRFPERPRSGRAGLREKSDALLRKVMCLSLSDGKREETPAAVAAGTVVAVRQIKKKKNEKILAGVKAKVEEYKKSGDTEKAKFYDDFYQKLEKTCLDDKGKPRVSPDLNKLPEKDRELFSTLYNRIKKNKNIIKAGKTSTPKEQVVKYKDGSEIHARRKKTGIGMTYIRMKGGKEIGYATKDEFRAAKNPNESYVGLSDYIRESVE